MVAAKALLRLTKQLQGRSLPGRDLNLRTAEILVLVR